MPFIAPENSHGVHDVLGDDVGGDFKIDRVEGSNFTKAITGVSGIYQQDFLDVIGDTVAQDVVGGISVGGRIQQTRAARRFVVSNTPLGQLDVLADQELQELGFTGARRAEDVDMRYPVLFRQQDFAVRSPPERSDGALCPHFLSLALHHLLARRDPRRGCPVAARP